MKNVTCRECGNNEYVLPVKFKGDFYCPECAIIPECATALDIIIIIKDGDGARILW